jgi:hypothetical protein
MVHADLPKIHKQIFLDYRTCWDNQPLVLLHEWLKQAMLKEKTGRRDVFS